MNWLQQISELIDRCVVASMFCALTLVHVFGTAARAETGGKEIVRVERNATPTEHAKYPSEIVVRGDSAFDGSYQDAGPVHPSPDGCIGGFMSHRLTGRYLPGNCDDLGEAGCFCG